LAVFFASERPASSQTVWIIRSLVEKIATGPLVAAAPLIAAFLSAWLTIAIVACLLTAALLLVLIGVGLAILSAAVFCALLAPSVALTVLLNLGGLAGFALTVSR
jgi:hypothetical protein